MIDCDGRLQQRKRQKEIDSLTNVKLRLQIELMKKDSLQIQTNSLPLQIPS